MFARDFKSGIETDSWVTSDYWDPEDQDLVLRPALEVVGCVGVCGLRKKSGKVRLKRYLLFPAPSLSVLKVLGEISFQPRHFGLIDNSSAAFFSDESKTPNLGD